MTQIGSVYARALYDLAKEEDLCRDILDELTVLQTAFAETPDFIRLLSAPNLPKDTRCQIIDDSFAQKVNPYVLNFLKILTEKGYIRYFSDCCSAYRSIYNEENGILPVKVVTAAALSPQQHARLNAKLSTITGKQVEMHCTVDPSCIGGVRLDYDGKQLDDTIRHRLDAIRSLLKNTML